MRQQKLLSSGGRSSLQQQGLALGWLGAGVGCGFTPPEPRGGAGAPLLTHTQVQFQKCPDFQEPQSRMDRELGQAGSWGGGREASSDLRHLQNWRRNELIPADPLGFTSPNPPLGNGGSAQTPAPAPALPAPTRTCLHSGPEGSPPNTWLPPDPAFHTAE